MKFNVTISDDTVDGLVQTVLLDDYRNLNRSIQDLMQDSTTHELPGYQQEDLANNIRYRDALKIMLEYYLENSRYQAEVVNYQE